MLVRVSRFRSVLTQFPCYATPTVSSYVGYNCSTTAESKLLVPASPVKIHTGTASFSRIRNTPGLIYIDNTRFFQKLLEDETDAILFCRLRRFGKTLTLSMLECSHAVQLRNSYDTLFKLCLRYVFFMMGWISLKLEPWSTCRQSCPRQQNPAWTISGGKFRFLCYLNLREHRRSRNKLEYGTTMVEANRIAARSVENNNSN
jgi:hypothetical protein